MTKILAFSYFVFNFIHCSLVIKYINNIKIFDKATTHGIDFWEKGFSKTVLQKSSHDAVITVFDFSPKGKMSLGS